MIWKWLDSPRFSSLEHVKVVRVSKLVSASAFIVEKLFYLASTLTPGVSFNQDYHISSEWIATTSMQAPLTRGTEGYTVLARTWAPLQVTPSRRLAVHRQLGSPGGPRLILCSAPDEITLWTTALIPPHDSFNPYAAEEHAVPNIPEKPSGADSHRSSTDGDSDPEGDWVRSKRPRLDNEEDDPVETENPAVNEWPTWMRLNLSDALAVMSDDEREKWSSIFLKEIDGIQDLSVSPGDAEWIFAVGKHGMMVVWRRERKDG